MDESIETTPQIQTQSPEITGSGTISTPESSLNPFVTAPENVSATLTDEHKETLLQRIEDLPEEIVAWVKKELSKI